MNEELQKLYEHVDDIEIAMMTTRRADGHLQSRAMATQKRAEGADLWFVTTDDTREAARSDGRSARQPVVLQGPHAGMGLGVGHRHDLARPRRRFMSSTRPTGSCGSQTKATRAMAPRTTRAWS